MKQMMGQLLKIVIPIIGPIVFEISNIVTGSWITNDGRFNLSTGKFITLLIAIAYLTVIIYWTFKDRKKQQNEEQLEKKIECLSSEKGQFINILNEVGNVISYSCKGVKKQSEVLSKNNNTEIRELSIVNFATTVCTVWYNLLAEKYGKEHITVNIYHKYKKTDGKEYETMIAHEGHITQPKYFGQERLLKTRRNLYYAEKLLMQDNPEIVLLLTPDKVAEAFNKSVVNCKYKQYIAIPIIDRAGKMRLMVEINVLDESMFLVDTGSIKKFLNLHFSCLKEYLLLMINMEDYARVVDQKLTGGTPL